MLRYYIFQEDISDDDDWCWDNFYYNVKDKQKASE